MTDGTNNGIDGYSQTRVGDHTILTPKDKKASVYQKVTPREQYAVARDVANRAINEINAIRGDRPSSFTGSRARFKNTRKKTIIDPMGKGVLTS